MSHTRALQQQKVTTKFFESAIAELRDVPTVNNADTLLDALATAVSRDGRIESRDPRRTRLIVVDKFGVRTAVEIQYKLTHHRAQDGGRYDFWKRVQLLEELIDQPENKVDQGFVLFITDDHLYWEKVRTNKRPIDLRFTCLKDVLSDPRCWNGVR